MENNESKDKGFVKEVETVLKEVELKVNRNNEEQIDKIIFNTVDGEITWKPKVEKTSYEGGYKVLKKVPMERGLLPKKLNEMAIECNEKGKVKVKVAYNWWETEQDGKPVKYRFILSQKTFEENWEIIQEPIEQERVE